MPTQTMVHARTIYKVYPSQSCTHTTIGVSLKLYLHSINMECLNVCVSPNGSYSVFFFFLLKYNFHTENITQTTCSLDEILLSKYTHQKQIKNKKKKCCQYPEASLMLPSRIPKITTFLTFNALLVCLFLNLK